MVVGLRDERLTVEIARMSTQAPVATEQAGDRSPVPARTDPIEREVERGSKSVRSFCEDCCFRVWILLAAVAQLFGDGHLFSPPQFCPERF